MSDPHFPLRPSHSRIESFRYAFAGWWYMLRTQPNTWIHTFFSVAAIVVGLWLGIPTGQWTVLALTIGLVWSMEFVNTALEAAVDLASPDVHPSAKIAKDVMAGAVLTAAGTAIIVGLIIFGPPLYNRLLSVLP
jgi:diacylglycerol kinase